MATNYLLMQFYAKYIYGQVADFGCGNGQSTLQLLNFVDQVTAIHGYDVDPKALRQAFDNMNVVSPPIHVDFSQADILFLPVEEESFDTIVSFNTLDHIDIHNGDKFASTVHRTLKTGGSFIISISYDKYTADTLSKLFEKHGFETIECMKDNRWPNQKNLVTGLFRKL